MKNYSLSHLANGALLHGLSALAAHDRVTTAEFIAHIAETDVRKLYVPAGHPSMHSYCMQVLKLSEQAALKRIRVGRMARRFPAIFDAITEGRLNLSTLLLLKPHLTEENADELLGAAANKSKAEVERLVAALCPKPDVAPRIEPVVQASSPGSPTQLSPGTVETPSEPSRVAPLAPQRFALQLTMSQEAHDQLRYAQSLLGKTSAADLPEVIARALDALVSGLEKQKFAKTNRPRTKTRRSSSQNPRHIPAHVKNAVWERDGGRCAFVSENGTRCPACTRLEFDHVIPVAKGGESTISNLRLRCRAHNQYEAECTFGASFMANKREDARRHGATCRDRIVGATACEAAAHDEPSGPCATRSVADQTAEARDRDTDVIPWLRALGFRATEARRAAERCEAIPDAPLEERVRFALSSLAPRTSARPLRV